MPDQQNPLVFNKIPNMSCTGSLAILRVVRDFATTLDTADLVATYEFEANYGSASDVTARLPESDISRVWEAEAIKIASSEAATPITGTTGCVSGDKVDQADSTYISFYKAALTAQGSRSWVVWPIPCSSQSEDGGASTESVITFAGAVSFANPRVTGHGMPPFIPRPVGGATGRGGGESTGNSKCSPNSVTVRVYNAGETPLKPYMPVGLISGSPSDNVYGCVRWDSDWADYPWGVLLPSEDDEDEDLKPATANKKDDTDSYRCCVIQGLVKIPDKYIQYTSGTRIDPIIDTDVSEGTGESSEYYVTGGSGQGRLISQGSGLILLDRSDLLPSTNFVIGKYAGRNENGDRMFDILTILSDGTVVTSDTVVAPQSW